MTALALSAALVALALAAAAAELRRRAELVARACHEVRGPLTAAGLALAGSARRGEAPPARLVAAEHELLRAGRAVDDVLVAARGRRRSERREPVDVRLLLERHAAVWRAVARALGRSVRVGDGLSAAVRGDDGRLGQAIANLVGNALEHGSGTVEVRARAGHGHVRVEVADEGGGPPAAALRRRPVAGHGERGRGLAIAREIAVRHGGRLLPAPGGVAIELPLEPAPPPPEPDPRRPA